MQEDTARSPKWGPLGALERRVLGVLVEKAKTTPDAYPMSKNAIATGCSQKNSRFPQMTVEEDDLDDVLDRLRELGAITEIQGGRVERYRHLLYEWFGVEKHELAVMAELLLRGAQTTGELRGRADRMENIPDLNFLKTVLDSLLAKNLIVSLSPPGRGQVVTHNLYSPQELERVKKDYAAGAFGRADATDDAGETKVAVQQAARAILPTQADLDSLRRDVALLREEIEALKEEWKEFKLSHQAS